nr:hypothetical protein HAGR004_03400 [Bdellovibrio sp. HAGR004]
MKNNRHSYNLFGISGKNTTNPNPLFENSIDKDGALNASGDIEKEWMSSKEAAAYLRISPATLRNLTSNGKIPYHKLERRNRYRTSDLRDLLLRNKRGGF